LLGVPHGVVGHDALSFGTRLVLVHLSEKLAGRLSRQPIEPWRRIGRAMTLRAVGSEKTPGRTYCALSQARRIHGDEEADGTRRNADTPD
jgi:hypothetical protein